MCMQSQQPGVTLSGKETIKAIKPIDFSGDNGLLIILYIFTMSIMPCVQQCLLNINCNLSYDKDVYTNQSTKKSEHSLW